MRTLENSVQEITLKFRKNGLLTKGEADGKDGWMLAKFFFGVSTNKRKKRVALSIHLDRSTLVNRGFISTTADGKGQR